MNNKGRVSGQTQDVSSVMSTRSLKEAKFGGYSVAVSSAPSGGTRASNTRAPDIRLNKSRSLLQMLCDWWDSSSGKTPVHEARKVEALIDFIETGDVYGKDGKRKQDAATLSARIGAFKQVLGGKYATSQQKASAADALNVFLNGQKSVDLQELKGLRSALANNTLFQHKTDGLVAIVNNRIEVLEMEANIAIIGNVGTNDNRGNAITLGRCMVACKMVLDSKVATPKQKQKACQNLLQSLERASGQKGEIYTVGSKSLRDIKDVLDGILDTKPEGLAVYQGALTQLQAAVDLRIARMEIDESIEKLGKPVEIPDKFVQGEIDKVNGALKNKIATCRSILNNANATPSQKMKAAEALVGVFAKVDGKYIKADVLKELEEALEKAEGGVKDNLSQLRDSVALKRDLFLLKSGGIPGLVKDFGAALGGNPMREARVDERLAAFDSVMKNEAASTQNKEEAKRLLHGFLGRVDRGDQETGVDHFLRLTPEQATRDEFESYENRLDRAIDEQKAYIAAKGRLGLEASPKDRQREAQLGHMRKGLSALSAALVKGPIGRDGYMSILKERSPAPFKYDAIVRPWVLGAGALHIFHMKAVREGVNWNNSDGGLMDTDAILANGFNMVSDRESYLE